MSSAPPIKNFCLCSEMPISVRFRIVLSMTLRHYERFLQFTFGYSPASCEDHAKLENPVSMLKSPTGLLVQRLPRLPAGENLNGE